jgi:hypothetical protein
MAAIACSPTTATKDNTAVLISASALTPNDASGYDPTAYPTEPAILYYIEASATGATTLTSERFSGAAFSIVWMFDTAATYTVAVKKDSDDSTVASTTIVVS